MKINEAGLAIIKRWEGLEDGNPDTPGLDPYICPAGVATIGWGSTYGFDDEPVTMDHRPISIVEAGSLLSRDVADTEDAILYLVADDIVLSGTEFSALVSLVYNIGQGAFKRSTLLRKINDNDFEGAADEFPKWRKAGGVVLQGLVDRRADERALFVS